MLLFNKGTDYNMKDFNRTCFGVSLVMIYARIVCKDRMQGPYGRIVCKDRMEKSYGRIVCTYATHELCSLVN